MKLCALQRTLLSGHKHWVIITHLAAFTPYYPFCDPPATWPDQIPLQMHPPEGAKPAKLTPPLNYPQKNRRRKNRGNARNLFRLSLPLLERFYWSLTRSWRVRKLKATRALYRVPGKYSGSSTWNKYNWRKLSALLVLASQICRCASELAEIWYHLVSLS